VRRLVDRSWQFWRCVRSCKPLVRRRHKQVDSLDIFLQSQQQCAALHESPCSNADRHRRLPRQACCTCYARMVGFVYYFVWHTQPRVHYLLTSDWVCHSLCICRGCACVHMVWRTSGVLLSSRGFKVRPSGFYPVIAEPEGA
jgi:hypothetical protein